MAEELHRRVPTGISSFDPVLDGGMPPGSVVLLLGSGGSGNQEFVYSSLISLAKSSKEGVPAPGVAIPGMIEYITFTRLASSVREEVALSFGDASAELMRDSVVFLDLSEIYFDASIVPTDWYSKSSVVERFQKKKKDSDGILSELTERLSAVPPGSLIVLDSVTELSNQHPDTASWRSLVAFFRGLERVAKSWGSVIYLLLSDSILEERKLAEISDCCDAVIHFQWEESSARRRQRVMYIEKFRGIMTHLEEQDFVKFAVKITVDGGFEVTNIRVVI